MAKKLIVVEINFKGIKRLRVLGLEERFGFVRAITNLTLICYHRLLFLLASLLARVKKYAPQITVRHFLRSEADSNRCRRFCRPLVKPLAHQTIANQVISPSRVISPNRSANIDIISELPKYFGDFLKKS